MSSLTAKVVRLENCENALKYVLDLYMRQLSTNPVLTKSFSSATIAALSDIIAQDITNRRSNKSGYGLRSTAAMAAFGVVAGPLVHYWYMLLEKLIPTDQKVTTAIGKMVVDRIVFAPGFMLLFFYVVNLLEGKTLRSVNMKVNESFWPALKMNWRVWPVIQYINLKYVPLEYRVLVGNLFALIWSVYIAMKRR